MGVIGAISFGAGWQTHSWKTDAEKLSVIKTDIKEVDTKAVKHEDFKVKERIKYVTIYKNVDKIVQVPFYTDGNLCLDDNGLRAANAAISSTTASQLEAEVPASGVTP